MNTFNYNYSRNQNESMREIVSKLINFHQNLPKALSLTFFFLSLPALTCTQQTIIKEGHFIILFFSKEKSKKNNWTNFVVSHNCLTMANQDGQINILALDELSVQLMHINTFAAKYENSIYFYQTFNFLVFFVTITTCSWSSSTLLLANTARHSQRSFGFFCTSDTKIM